MSNKQLRRISNAGQWTRVLALVSIVSTPVLSLMSQLAGVDVERPGEMQLHLISCAIGIFLYVSGRYVQFFGGQRVGLFMALNMLLAIFAFGLVGLIVLVVSVFGLFALRAYQKDGKKLPVDAKKATVSRRELMGLAAAILAGSLIVYYV